MLKRIDVRFVAQVKRQWKPLVLGLACAFFGAVIELGTIAFIKLTIEATQDANTRRLAQLALAVIALYVFKYWFTLGKSYYLTMAAHRLTADLRKQLFAKLQSLPVAYFNEKRTGAIQSVLTNDVAVIQGGVPLVRDIVESPVLAFGGLAALFILNWKLASAALIAVPPVAVAIMLNARKVRKAQMTVQENLGEMTAMMQESLSAVRVIKSFSAEEREVVRFGGHVEQTFRSNMRVVRRVARLKPLVELIGAVAVAAAIWLGGTLIAAREMGVAHLMAFIFALDRVIRGATGIGNMSNTYSQVQAAINRVYREVLDVESDLKEDREAITLNDPKGHIEFRNVSFTYPDGTQALEDVSFEITPGTSVALVGRSGAGKSTIADLLLRFYDPTKGHIMFDGADIRKLKSTWLRERVGVVPQQTLLFAGTIRDNIAFGKPDAHEREIVCAAERAHAREFIEAMPERYETVLGERGIRLSGGEMQRIALARALLKDPTVLLLDEATSSLDAMSERKIQEALNEVMQERTTLLIAHRLTTAARADQVIVLSRGRIVEKGSHDGLMAANGTYAGMYRAFSTGVLGGSID